MKVIFLDVEGVLNTKETYDRIYRQCGHTTMIDVEIDKFRLEYLKTIIDKTGAKIVLSSSFRYFFYKDGKEMLPKTLKGKKLYDTLKGYGIEIYDITPTNSETREEQIKNWLATKTNIESFVIIDDDPTVFDELYDNLIITSTKKRSYVSSFMKESIGLCEEHIPEVVNKLTLKVLKKIR